MSTVNTNQKGLKAKIKEFDKKVNGNLFESLKIFGSGTLGAAIVAGIAWGSMSNKVETLEENQAALIQFKNDTSIELEVIQETLSIHLSEINRRLKKIEEQTSKN